jgi:hypothetical protein
MQYPSYNSRHAYARQYLILTRVTDMRTFTLVVFHGPLLAETTDMPPVVELEGPALLISKPAICHDP